MKQAKMLNKTRNFMQRKGLIMLPDILKSYGYSRKIRKKEFDAPEKLQGYQWKCLKETLYFAFTKIPYYIESYQKSGILFQDIQTWGDFRKLPILTRQEKRSHPPEAFKTM